MYSSSIKKINNIGKIGYIIVTIITVISIIASLGLATLSCVVITSPDDRVSVSIVGNKAVATYKPFLGDAVRYFYKDNSGNVDGDITISNGKTQIARASVKRDINSGVTSIHISGNMGEKAVKQNAMEDNHMRDSSYRKNEFFGVAISAFISSVIITVSLFILKSLLKGIKKCETPFSADVIKKMKMFAISLIPVAIALSVSETLGMSFLSGKDSISIFINWGMFVAAVVVFVLVRIFDYGVKLQTESDETL